MLGMSKWFGRKRAVTEQPGSSDAGKILSDWMLVPYLSQDQRQRILESGDPIRYGTIFLALERITKEGLQGSLAECGVYRGALSKFIHDMLPDRRLFLFDTFEGFDQRDSETQNDERFKDTSVQFVLEYIGRTDNVIIRKGYFPDTARGLEDERFVFVMLDFDKFEPTLAALEFFYPRMERGGFLFIHDYNSPESSWASAKAVDGFLADKPEKLIFVPDAWGTALFRKY